MAASTIADVRCPSCGETRIAIAAVPGDEPGPIRVCLRCAHLWSEEEEEPAHDRG